MFESRAIAQQFLEHMEPSLQGRLDAFGQDQIMHEATKALRTLMIDYPQQRQLVNSFSAAAIASLPTELRQDSADLTQLALAQTRKMSEFYQQHYDDGREMLGVFAEVPITTAVALQQRLGDGAVFRSTEHPEKFHITLCYMGRKFPEELSNDNLEKLTRSIGARISDIAPLHGGITGYGRMKGSMAGGAALYASPKLMGLVALRQLVKAGCEDAGFKLKGEYDFVPHITLGYLELDSPTPMIDLDDEIPLTLNTLRVEVGRNTYATLTLDGDRRLDATMMPFQTYEWEKPSKRIERIVQSEDGNNYRVVKMPHGGEVLNSPMKAHFKEADNSPESTTPTPTIYVGPHKTKKTYKITKKNPGLGESPYCLMVGYQDAQQAREAYKNEIEIQNRGLISMRQPWTLNESPNVSTRRDRQSRTLVAPGRLPDDEDDVSRADASNDFIGLINRYNLPLLPWDDSFPGFAVVEEDYAIPDEFSFDEYSGSLDSLLKYGDRLAPMGKRVDEYQEVYESLCQAEKSFLLAFLEYRLFGNVFGGDYLNRHPKPLEEARKALREVESKTNNLRKALPDVDVLVGKYQSIQVLILYLETLSSESKYEHFQGLKDVRHTLSVMIAAHELLDFVTSRIETIRKYSMSLPTVARQLPRDKTDFLREGRTIQSRMSFAPQFTLPELYQDMTDLLVRSSKLHQKALKMAKASNALRHDEYSVARVKAILGHGEDEIAMYLRLKENPKDLEEVLIGNDQDARYAELLQADIQKHSDVFKSGGTGKPQIKHSAIKGNFGRRLSESAKVIKSYVMPTLDSPISLLVSEIEAEVRYLRNELSDFNLRINGFAIALEKFMMGLGESPDALRIQSDAIAVRRELKYFTEGMGSYVKRRIHLVEERLDEYSDLGSSGLIVDRYYEIVDFIRENGVQQLRKDQDKEDLDLTSKLYKAREKTYSGIIKTWLHDVLKWIRSKKTLQQASTDINELTAKMGTDELVKQLEQDMSLLQKAGASDVVDERDPNNIRLDSDRMDAKIPKWFKMPFTEANEFFAAKEILPTFSTANIPDSYHSWAFMVSGVTRGDILSSIKWLLDQAMEKGTTEKDFHKTFDRLVGRKGWRPGSERVQFIFTTNMRSAYSDGRYKQIFENPDTPDDMLLLWRHGDSPSPRPLHLKLHNKAIPKAHKFWKTAYPACAYGCKCTAIAITKDLAERRKFEILLNPPDPRTIAEEGWRTNPSMYFDPTNRDRIVTKAKKRLHPDVRLALPS